MPAGRPLGKRHQDKNWKYYVYQFTKHEKIVYVGKGCNKRFNVQSKRFNDCVGNIIAFFKTEQDALNYETALIKKYKPSYNKLQVPSTAAPWKYALLPEKDKDFYVWCEVLGTKQMSLRVLLSKSWSSLKEYGIDVKRLLSKLENCEVFNGLRN